MATMAAQGTQPAAGAEMAAAPITDTDNNVINTYNGNNADENNVDYTSTDGIDALGQATVATALKTIENTGAGAGGIREVLQLGLDPASGVGTANDGGRLVMYVDDDGNGESDIAYIDWVLTTATAGSEVGRLDFYVAASGAPASQMQILDGSVIPTTDSDVSLGVTGTRWSDFYTDAATVGGALTLGGAVALTNTLTVGVNDTGHDVQFFGATAGNHLLWDESTDDLVLVGSSELYLFDAGGGEHISSDGTDMTINAGNDLNLTAVTDVNIPANVGLTFGDDGEKIEGNGTDLTISGNNINLTAVADIVVPADVGITFGAGEKIEGDSTDLTVTSGGAINLTATTDVVIPANVGITFGSGEKIEGDSTDLTLTSGADIALTATGDVNIPSGVGVTFGDDGEKIEGDGTDLTITSSNILNLTAAAVLASTQPALLAYQSTSQSNVGGNTGTPVKIDFGTEIFDQGADFSGGIFTAPVTGRYQINFNVFISGITAACTQVQISAVASNRTWFLHRTADPTLDHTQMIVSGAALIDMDAADTVQIQYLGSGEASDVHDIIGGASPNTSFSCFLAC